MIDGLLIIVTKPDGKQVVCRPRNICWPEFKYCPLRVPGFGGQIWEVRDLFHAIRLITGEPSERKVAVFNACFEEVKADAFSIVDTPRATPDDANGSMPDKPAFTIDCLIGRPA